MITAIVGLPLLLCALSFPIARCSYFREHEDPRWVRSSEEIFAARDVPCDVVVYGDSTAITGIDPDIIRASTGLNTCNIAQTKAVLVVLGMRPLDTYLAHNPKPKFLVLQFAASDFYKPENWNDTGSYMEGVITLFRFYPSLLPDAALRHPELLEGMMHYAYITGPLHWRAGEAQSGGNDRQHYVSVHFTLPKPGFHNCAEAQDSDHAFHRPDGAYIQALRSRYARQADHLLIDAAPVSACDGRFDSLRHTVSGVDNALEQYPVTFFNDGYTHYTALGARRLSQEIVQQIRNLQERPPVADNPRNLRAAVSPEIR